MDKEKVIKLGYSNVDIATYYRCPRCSWVFTNWDIWRQDENKNCPRCKVQLEGFEQ